MTQAVRLEIPVVLPGVGYGDACIRRLAALLSTQRGVEAVHVIPPGESAPADRIHRQVQASGAAGLSSSRGEICVHIDADRTSLTAVVDSALDAAATLGSSYGHARFRLPLSSPGECAVDAESALAQVEGVIEVRLEESATHVRLEYDLQRLEAAELSRRARVLGLVEPQASAVPVRQTRSSRAGDIGGWLRGLLRMAMLVAATCTLVGCGRAEEHEGKPMSYWVSQITSPDSARRHAAAEAFAHDAARSPEAARALLAVLATERAPDVHATVADALGNLGAEGAGAVPELIRLLQDEHDVVRERAASALGHVGGGGAPVVEALTAALGDADHDVRASAAGALAELGPSASRSVPALLQLAQKDRIGWVRLEAVRALGEIAEPTDSVRSFLAARATNDEWAAMREGALNALALHGNAARSALAAIRRAARDSDPDVRNAAARAQSAAGGVP